MCDIATMLDSTAREIGLEYDEHAITKCVEYISLLHTWNKRTNLVGKQNQYEIASDLCIDSIHLAYILQHTQYPMHNIIDCGAGAGIPGIPLRCFYTLGTYTMIECRQKRVLFIESALRRLMLPDTLCKEGRVEDICPHLALDTIVSRAFMPPERLLPFAYQFLQQGQYLILMLHTDTTSMEGYKSIYSYSYIVADKERYICILQKQ